MTSVVMYVVLIAVVALERLAELVVSQRHLRWAKQRGGIETGRGHYPFMVLLHSALLGGCVLEVIALDRRFEPLLGWPMLTLVLASQALRWWCVSTLGKQWNTRVVVVAGLPRVASGPYRWLRHPNYLAVVSEGIALPLVHGAWLTAATFTALNAVVLSVRIRCENAALAALAAGAR